jgi:subtilisin family serine protease
MLPVKRAQWIARAVLVVGVLGTLLVSSTTASGSAAPTSYLLLGKGNKLPPGLAAKVAAAGGAMTSSVPEIGVAFAVSSEGDFQAKASTITGLESASHSIATQWVSPEPSVAGASIEFGNPPTSGDDDGWLDFQWGHDAVDAPEAWNAGYRGDGARVAVIDTGFDTDHPDLAPNVNFALSKSFVPGEALAYALPGPFSHGSHTAGTIAAADNGLGTIGIAPDAELVLVKGLPDTGCGSDAPILEGIVYAAGIADADVISMSLGAPLEKSGYLEPGCLPGTADDVWVTAKEVAEARKAWGRAVDYAMGQGATVIASAGNDAMDKDHTNNAIHLPSDTPGVISIAATAPIGWATDPANTYLDNQASYTNYGQSAIDFAAPGGDAAYPGNENCTLGVGSYQRTVPCWVFDLVFSTGSNLNPGVATYYWSAGTSMAAPHAAGVAAIIIGKNGGSMSPAHVEAALRKSADDLGKPGNDDLGAGRVNAASAVGG